MKYRRRISHCQFSPACVYWHQNPHHKQELNKYFADLQELTCSRCRQVQFWRTSNDGKFPCSGTCGPKPPKAHPSSKRPQQTKSNLIDAQSGALHVLQHAFLHLCRTRFFFASSASKTYRSPVRPSLAPRPANKLSAKLNPLNSSSKLSAINFEI